MRVKRLKHRHFELLEGRWALSADAGVAATGIQYDAGGWALIADPLPRPADLGAEAADTITLDGPPIPSAPAIPLSELPRWHSRPEATKKIFLDFDGQVVSGTNWNTQFQGRAIHAVPYDIDNDIDSFSEQEVARIERIWARVAEDYAPFDVDVTTEEPPLSAFSAGRRAKRVMISTRTDDTRVGGTGETWYPSAGGVAYINSWNWQSDTPVWVFHDEIGSSDKNVGEAASHEMGHALGLTHDGQNADEYYKGHGSGATDWAPIMGVGYSRDVTQWSRGEYSGATNMEDDVATLAAKLSYRIDDHANQLSLAATPIDVTSGSLSATGVIERATDLDVFRFDVGLAEAVLNLQASPAKFGGNLDILLQLYDGQNQLIASSNPGEQLGASLQVDLGPGVYYVMLDGVGKSPLETGYSDYGSLGQYTLQGDLQIRAADYHVGDLDADGAVDAADAAILFGQWGDFPTLLPGVAPEGQAVASYNRWTGEVIVSGNGVNSWFIESPSGGLTAQPLSNAVPIHGGVVTDKDERVGELAFSVFSFVNVSLGRIAVPGLTDVQLLYSAGISTPVRTGTVVTRYAAPSPVSAGTAVGLYNAASGEVAIAAQNVVSWYIESVSGGLIGSAPVNIPAVGGTLVDTNQRIGESADTPFSVSNLQLGAVALPRLPDVTLYYQTTVGGAFALAQLETIGLSDLNLDGLTDAADAGMLFGSWTG